MSLVAERIPFSILLYCNEGAPLESTAQLKAHMICLLKQSAYAPTEESVRTFLDELSSCVHAQGERKMLVVAYEQNCRLAAFAQFRFYEDSADLDFVLVDQERRGRGLARKLLLSAFERLKKAGVHRVLLEVGLDNSQAASLYRMLGFTEIARRKKYYRGVEDALVMELAL